MQRVPGAAPSSDPAFRRPAAAQSVGPPMPALCGRELSCHVAPLRRRPGYCRRRKSSSPPGSTTAALSVREPARVITHTHTHTLAYGSNAGRRKLPPVRGTCAVCPCARARRGRPARPAGADSDADSGLGAPASRLPPHCAPHRRIRVRGRDGPVCPLCP